MPIFQMLYLSRTRVDWTEAELNALTAHAQDRNTRDGVTGLLLYGHGHFLQLLEGRRQPLLLTYDRITRDPRHTDIRLLLDRSTRKRTFSSWAMGLLNLNTTGEVHLERFTRLTQAVSVGSMSMVEDTLALTLLQEFRRQLAMSPRVRLPELP